MGDAAAMTGEFYSAKHARPLVKVRQLVLKDMQRKKHGAADVRGYIRVRIRTAKMEMSA